MRFVNNVSLKILDISKQTPTYSAHVQQDINSPRVYAMWLTPGVIQPSQWQQCRLTFLFAAEGESMLHIPHTTRSRCKHVRLGSRSCCVYISVTCWPCDCRRPDGPPSPVSCCDVIICSSAGVQKMEQLWWLWSLLLLLCGSSYVKFGQLSNSSPAFSLFFTPK